MYPDTVAYYCNFCDRRIFNVTPRYHVKVCVADDTGSANFLIFDRAASAFFKKDCSEMVKVFEQVTLFECFNFQSFCVPYTVSA